MSMCLPKRELLLLRTVLAFPRLSRIGFVASSFEEIWRAAALKSTMKARQTLVASVLPAPDSPLIRIDSLLT